MKTFLKILAILAFALLSGIVIINVHAANNTSALAQGAYPAPNSESITNNQASVYSAYPAPQTSDAQNLLPPPTEAPVHVPVAVSIALDLQIEGLETNDSIQVELIPDTIQTANDITSLHSSLAPIQLSNGNQHINLENIPAGSYKLVVSAPSEYFREPQGFLFRISEAQKIERTSELPLHFKLIPPSEQQIPPCRDYSKDSTQQQNTSPNDISAKECLAERIVDLSGPHKAPTITSQNAPDASRYFYAHVHNTNTNWGVWGRMSVSDPEVLHGGDFHHIVEHVYATLDYNKWIEAGWAEVSWRDNRQYIFQFDSTNQTWNFYDQYSIAKGDKVTVLVQNDGGTYWKARLYRSGVYNVLARVDVGFTSVPHSFNGFENYSGTGAIH